MTPALLQTLNELESAAKEATPGEWISETGHCYWVRQYPGARLCQTMSLADQTHIVATQPSRILSLCAMVREQLGWISVESALPDPNDPHRSEATDPDYSEFVAVLDSFGDWYRAFWCFSRKEWIFSDSVADEILLPVTHWKPMDHPPPSAESEASK